MSFSTWLKSWWRPSRRKQRRSQTSRAVLPVPRMQRSRTNSRLPRFNSSVSEPDSVAASPNASISARLSLAFTPAQPVADLRGFAGRTELVERLIRTIEDRRMHVVLHGDRGIGKTSLLHVLTILAREARYLVRYTSCSEDSEFDSLFRAVAADIPVRYHRDFDPASAEAEQGLSLADLVQGRPLTPTNLSEEFAKVAGTRILLILDEFDRATSPAFRKAVAELVKNLSDRSARVQLVIGGVAANLTELVAHIPSIRRNVLGIQVGPMSDEELLQIVANAEAVGRFRFDEPARVTLLAAANGSPYHVNLIGQLAARSALTRDTAEITAEDVLDAIAQVEGELRSRLAPEALDQLQALERTLGHEDRLAIARQAQHAFGQLLPEQHATIAASLRGAGNGAWTDAGGLFHFVDDSIPVILSLAAVNADVEARA